MPFGMRIIELVGPITIQQGQPRVGQWVKAYDPDAGAGRGFVDVTNKEEEALIFDTPEEAWDCWKQQSAVKPVREDGKPNRPLTAFTIMVEEI